MTYAKISNDKIIEYPVYEGDIRLRYPNTSFPIPFEPPAEYIKIQDIPPPSSLDYTKSFEEGPPIKENGIWKRNWIVRNASEEEIKQRTERKETEVKNIRNKLLSDTDWTQIPDNCLTKKQKDNWKVYRKALREITGQAEYPWKVNWPERP